MIKDKINKFLIIVLICTLILSCFCFFSVKNVNNVSANAPTWAQIKNSNTYLLKSAELESTTINKWCYLEKSYFVKILNNYNADYYKVEYNGITGFVLKSELTLINETPITPYPSNVTFSTGKTNCYLRSTPQIKDVTNNTLCVIPANTSGLKYIGKIIGEEAVDFLGSVWYLTSYNGQIGYIYSGYTTSVSEVVPNVEQVSVFTGDDFSKINPLTNTQCLVIITLTLIPCLFILIMLYAPKKAKKQSLHSSNKLKPSTKDYANFYDENL